MVADPKLAYAAQAEMLEKRLGALKEIEKQRTDRFPARTDVPPSSRSKTSASSSRATATSTSSTT